VSEAGLRAPELKRPEAVSGGSPSHASRRSGSLIRLDSITVAGAASVLHRLPVLPEGSGASKLRGLRAPRIAGKRASREGGASSAAWKRDKCGQVGEALRAERSVSAAYEGGRDAAHGV